MIYLGQKLNRELKTSSCYKNIFPIKFKKSFLEPPFPNSSIILLLCKSKFLEGVVYSWFFNNLRQSAFCASYTHTHAHTHTNTHTETIKFTNSLHVVKSNCQFSVYIVPNNLSAASQTVACSLFPNTFFFTWFLEHFTLLVGLPLRLLLFKASSKDYPSLQNL